MDATLTLTRAVNPALHRDAYLTPEDEALKPELSVLFVMASCWALSVIVFLQKSRLEISTASPKGQKKKGNFFHFSARK